MTRKPSLFTIALALLVGGCTRPAPLEPRPPTGAAGGFATSGCFACLAQQCAAELADCNGDPGCAAYLQCVLRCPTSATGDVDGACARACPIAESPTAAAAARAWGDCRSGGAGAVCAACGGGAGDGGIVDPLLDQHCAPAASDDSCSSCRQALCCATEAACTSNADCMQLTMCRQACQPADAACAWSCDLASPNGVAAFARRLACISFRCDAQCNPGGSGSCGECMASRCLTSDLALAVSADGLRFTDCMNAAASLGSMDPFGACAQLYPVAVPLINDSTLCSEQLCTAQCSGSR